MKFGALRIPAKSYWRTFNLPQNLGALGEASRLKRRRCPTPDWKDALSCLVFEPDAVERYNDNANDQGVTCTTPGGEGWHRESDVAASHPGGGGTTLMLSGCSKNTVRWSAEHVATRLSGRSGPSTVSRFGAKESPQSDRAPPVASLPLPKATCPSESSAVPLDPVTA